MRKPLMLTAAFFLLAGCGSPQTETNAVSQPVETAGADVPTSEQADVNAQLDAWFEDKFMESIRRYPQYLAQLGIKERMDEWNDPSRAFDIQEVDYARQQLAELRSTFDPEELDASHALSFRLFERQMEDQIVAYEWWEYNYPFNQMFGAQSGIPTFLLNQHRIDNVADAEAYIARLNGVDEYLGTIMDNARASADMGIMPPKFVYPYVISDAKNVITGAPFEDTEELNLLLADFQKKVEALELEEEERKALYEEAMTALLTSVGPAYEDLIELMQTQQDAATTEDGVWKLPRGDEFYAYRLNRMTTTDMSADEIHQLGLDEVARIHGEMRDIMDDVGFDGTLQEFFAFTREDPQFFYPNTEEGKARYLSEATALINEMKTHLDDVFLKTPKADLDVRAVEPFREKSAGKAFYNRPAPDGSRPGIYYANLYNMGDMPIYQMEALAYHEGIPGHHMQLAIAQELEGVPKFQKYGSVTAYTEGWGLYSEYLPKEMGFYEDPYSDFGRLAMEIWRAARLVVDTGLHHKEWTREEAIEYLMENTPNPRGDAVKAIERYIVMPGQATAYKIGMNKILELRAAAQDALGEDFDIREYHDIVLETGPVPLDILEERVNAYIAENQG